MLGATPLGFTPSPTAGLPSPATNRADALGARTSQALAKDIADQHARRLRERRIRDLEAERFLLMVDGEGDNQWAEIYMNQRVAIPPLLSPWRVTDNILRPIVDNQVSYLTTTPIRFLAQSRNDAQSRGQAVIDAALANHIASTQNLNGLLAAALYLADCTGFCPVHAAWRDDIGYLPYEPLYHTPEEMQQLGFKAPTKGIIDLYVGDPFDTTFNPGAKRNSVHVMRYGRVLPAKFVRDTFGVNVEGTDKFTSGSLMQRILRRWLNVAGLNYHGHGTLTGSEQGEEMIALVCQETAPGIDPQYPRGRLTCIALQGAAETGSGGGKPGTPVLLTDHSLPGGRFGAELFHAATQFDDVHGQRWIAPLAAHQRRLNSTLSDLEAWAKKTVNAPILASGDLLDDELQFNGTSVVTVNAGSFQPRIMALDAGVAQMLQNKAAEIKASAYTLGGYNAASRGESHAGDPAKKVEFLSEIDDTIHGPTKVQMFASAERLMQLCHALFRDNAILPWLLETTGGDYAESPQEYINRTHVSQTSPRYKVDLDLSGGTPASQASRLLSMVTTDTADKQPLLTTAEARRKWPDAGLFDSDGDPGAAQRTRAKRIAEACRTLSGQYRRQATSQMGQMGMQGQAIPFGLADPQVQQAGVIVANQLYNAFPPLPTDDVQAVMEELAQVTQDETEDGIARQCALLRWQEHQQQLQAQAQAQSQLVSQLAAAAQQLGGPQVQPAMPTQQQVAFA